VASQPRWPAEIVAELHARALAYFKGETGVGRPWVARQTLLDAAWSAVPELRLERLALQHGFAGKAPRERQLGPPVPLALIHDIPEELREAFTFKTSSTPLTLSDDEIVDLVKRDPRWLRVDAALVRLDYHQRRIRMGDDLDGASRSFLEAVGKALIPAASGRPQWHDEQAMARVFLTMKAFAEIVNAAATAIFAGHPTMSTAEFARALYLRLEQHGLTEPDAANPSTWSDEKAMDGLAEVGAVVTAPEDETKRRVIIGQAGWPRAVTLVFLMHALTCSAKTITDSLKTVKVSPQ
jgi:hypothetical protein